MEKKNEVEEEMKKGQTEKNTQRYLEKLPPSELLLSYLQFTLFLVHV